MKTTVILEGFIPWHPKEGMIGRIVKSSWGAAKIEVCIRKKLPWKDLEALGWIIKEAAIVVQF